MLQPLKSKEDHHFSHSLFVLVSRKMGKAEADVRCRGQVRKEGIVLWHVSDPPHLRGKVKLLRAVVHRLTVDHDTASVRMHRPGNRLQRQTFPGTGRTKEHDQFVLLRQKRRQAETRQGACGEQPQA